MKSVALLGILGSLMAQSAFADKPAAVDRPNIVYFMIDELGYYELSLMGHPEFRTPNVDRLAAEGTRFTQFLAGSSVCAPTRCTFLTGKYTGHCTVRNNGGFDPLLAGEYTIGTVLRNAGYATGGFGKWGNGGRGTSGVPETHGFDVFFGYYDQVHAHTYFPDLLPTFAELAGAKIPKDTDGLSLVPELLGQQAAGREQQQHQYLYWEIGNQTAVRMGPWKAYRRGGDQAPWQLYDLSKHVSETTDVAAQNPNVLAKLKAFAAEAHRPMPHGEVYDRALVEKDRHYFRKPARPKAKNPRSAKKRGSNAP